MREGVGRPFHPLGMIGLYGVIAYSVSQRMRELGIRLALGAQRAGIMRMILKEASLLLGVELFAELQVRLRSQDFCGAYYLM
ncbi:MAG: Macrolide-specific ABC-type efflux carrier [Edaphobacter sp.]|nr:Macrolide-specific ABC-type efflux carrier [Edaphobacter sp.]